ncbi:hypothetical protein PTTG_26189 [Puccinia triticina 1-1 BBBD Race 1]|uniref:Uncharacterized protein n=1 Tax=Puccinia triticina (isolate 1-1 / race 1 (BBBD)) TaxID=630390 RepID=A0A180GWM4_PUCT1|nr:hypothetical protein PTTG_26189 [Puccinia triticina 1-1 BBBD Race 1]
MAPVNQSPSSIATRSSNAAAVASSSNAAGKRVAVSNSSDNDIDTNKDHIIKHAYHLFPDTKKLLPSSTNFRTWLTKMEELADFALDYCNYYYEDFSCHPVNHIVRVIFRIALSDKIKEDINHADLCYAIMIYIRRCFTTFSRAAQINQWAALRSIECDQGVPATTVAATYRCQLLDLKESGAS